MPGHLGRTLADGWAAFDQGQLADAQRLGQQAMEIARSDAEQFIAERLWRLSRVLRDWVERNGVESEDRTQKALIDIEDLFTDPENRAINGFATQMPSTETYLKAMGQGLVQSFASANTAALRILFGQYILSGVLDAHDSIVDDARFWQSAAQRTLPDVAERHIALQKLEEFIERREALLNAANILDQIAGPQIVDSIGEFARQLEGSPQARLLAPGIQSLRALESALHDWADAEFRGAGNKIDQALRSITEAESNANIKLNAYRTWMTELHAALAELSVNRRNLTRDIDRQLVEPQPSIRDAIHLQADVTEDLLGFKHAQMMLGWRDTYEAFVGVYDGDKRRSQKLEAMDELFKAMFIDRNPAYPLFRHWYRLVESSPEEAPEEEEAPPEPAPDAEMTSPADDGAEPAAAVPEPQPAADSPGVNRWLYNAALLIGLILVVGGLLSLAASGNLERALAALLPNPTAASAANPDGASSSPVLAAEMNSPGSDATDALSAAPAETEGSEGASAAAEATAPAAATEPPAPTVIPSDIPTLVDSVAPPATDLPPEVLSGAHDLLDIYAAAQTDPFWNPEQFRLLGNSWRLGNGGETPGETIFFFPAADLLNRSYGEDAPRRIRQLEAELSLRSTNPTSRLR